MIKKIWDFLGNIRLSFWLLLAAAALFITGMLYSSFDYSYFRAMNEVRIQDWLARELPSRPGDNWWLVPLLAVLFLLGVNTVICTANRVVALFSGRTKTDYRFVVSLLPSAVHILFITVMLGHAMTVTRGTWTRTPIAVGSVVRVDPAAPALTVDRIEDIYFPEGSLLARRIKQTEVSLADGGGTELKLAFLGDMRYGGHRLHLDMEKRKMPVDHAGMRPQAVETDATCNRSETFRSAERKREPAQKLYLLAITDPGLPVILAAFVLILVFMTWYFAESLRKQNRETRTDNGARDRLY